MSTDPPRLPRDAETRPTTEAAAREGQLLRGTETLKLSRYVLIEPLGRGGSGIVYSAYDPELERRVAVKLLMAPRTSRKGSSRSASERLLREAQALAQLSHPNVIAIHDVGTYELDQARTVLGDAEIIAGGVFIVMEQVDGLRLDRWSRRRPRSRSELLEVVIQAGRGLEAAHQVGLVHRDFKPANVLVDDRGRVRVLDFGLARTAAPEGAPMDVSPRADDRAVTETGLVAGTPRYMAPEQHERGPLDARTDIYAFCVTLYELVCGRPPFVGETWAELFESKKAMEIERPARSSMPRWLWRALLVGMASDPGRRYPDITQLLAILERGRARRRQLVTGALAAAVIGGAGMASLSAAPHCAQLDGELRGAWDPEVATRVHDAFISTELPFAEQSYRSVATELDRWTERWRRGRTSHCEAQRDDPTSASYGPWLACLERQRERLAGLTQLLSKADPATVEAAVHSVGELGEPEACMTRRRNPGRDDAASIELATPLAEVRALLATHKHERAEALSQDLVRQAERRGSVRQHAEALLLHARALARLDRVAEAEPRAEQAIAEAERVFDTELTCEAATLLVEVLTTTGEFSAADTVARMTRSRLEADGASTRVAALLAASTGRLRLEQGRQHDAVAELERALELRSTPDTEDSLELAPMLERLGSALSEVGRGAQALATLDRARAIYERALGPNHPVLATLYTTIGRAQMADGRLEDAERSLVHAQGLLATSYEPLAAGTVLHHLAKLDFMRGEYTEAMRRLEEGLSILRRHRASSHPSMLRMRMLRAQLLSTQFLRRDAADELEDLLPLLQKILGRDHRDTIRAMLVLGAQLAELGEDRRARELLLSVVALTEAKEGVDSRPSAGVRLALARDYARTNQLDEAERLIRSSIEFYAEQPSLSHLAFQASVDMASVHYLRGDHAEEARELTRTLELARRSFGAEHLRLAKPYLYRGRALAALGDHARARADLQRAIELGPEAPWPPFVEVHARYELALSWASEDPARAEAWIAEARQQLEARSPSGEAIEPESGVDALREALAAWPEVPANHAPEY